MMSTGPTLSSQLPQVAKKIAIRFNLLKTKRLTMWQAGFQKASDCLWITSG